MKPRANLWLIAPAAAAGLAVTVLLVLAAHEHGKRRERRIWEEADAV